jgi:hypothetical protein
LTILAATVPIQMAEPTVAFDSAHISYVISIQAVEELMFQSWNTKFKFKPMMEVSKFPRVALALQQFWQIYIAKLHWPTWFRLPN